MSLLYKRKLHIYSLNFVPLFLKYSVFLCMYLPVYLWLCWVFTAVHGRSLVAVSGAPLLGARTSCAAFLVEHGLQPRGLLQLQLTGSGVVGHGPQFLWHVESSQLRDCLPALAGRPPIHCTTREVLDLFQMLWHEKANKHLHYIQNFHSPFNLITNCFQDAAIGH